MEVFAFGASWLFRGFVAIIGVLLLCTMLIVDAIEGTKSRNSTDSDDPSESP